VEENRRRTQAVLGALRWCVQFVNDRDPPPALRDEVIAAAQSIASCRGDPSWAAIERAELAVEQVRVWITGDARVAG